MDPWVDGLPRWVAVHIVLGTLAGGVFTDGESIADAEARLSETIGPVQLKLLLTHAYSGTGKTVRIMALRADTGQYNALTATIPPNSPVGTIIPLKWAPHDRYPSPSWFTDVTAAAETTGDGYLACQIVNDGPSWRSSTGCIVTHQAYSPWACDVLLAQWEPACRTAYLGRAHVVYNKEGLLVRRVWQVGQGAWGAPDYLTVKAGWPSACEHHAFDIVGGVLLVTCESAGTRVWFTSKNGGASWSYRSGNVAFTDLTDVQLCTDYLGRVWGLGLDSNGLLTAECSPDLGATGMFRTSVDPSAADEGQPGVTLCGGTFVMVAGQGGSLRTWVSKRGGRVWEQGPVVEP